MRAKNLNIFFDNPYQISFERYTVRAIINVHILVFLLNKTPQTLHGMKGRTIGDSNVSFVY